jgi:hypothetical protein
MHADSIESDTEKRKSRNIAPSRKRAFHRGRKTRREFI